MNTLTLGYIEITSHGESLRVILGVEEVPRLVLGTGDSLVVIINGKVLSLVGEGSIAVGDSVSWVPGHWETFSLGRVEYLVGSGAGVVWDGIGGETRLGVNTDGTSLGSIVVLGVEVLGVGASVDIESVSMIRSNENQSLF